MPHMRRIGDNMGKLFGWFNKQGEPAAELKTVMTFALFFRLRLLRRRQLFSREPLLQQFTMIVTKLLRRVRMAEL